MYWHLMCIQLLLTFLCLLHPFIPPPHRLGMMTMLESLSFLYRWVFNIAVRLMLGIMQHRLYNIETLTYVNGRALPSSQALCLWKKGFRNSAPPKGLDSGLGSWECKGTRGCQRLIFKATHGRSSLTVKWQAWQVACTLSWRPKHGTPEDGERGTNGCPVYRIPVSPCLIDGTDGSFVIL